MFSWLWKQVQNKLWSDPRKYILNVILTFRVTLRRISSTNSITPILSPHHFSISYIHRHFLESQFQIQASHLSNSRHQKLPKNARTCKAVGTKIWAHQNAQTYTRLQPPTSLQIHKEGVETVLLVILILGCRRIKPCCKVQVLNWQIPSQMEQEAAEIPICRAAATDCTSGSKILSLPADWNVIKSHFSMWEFKFSLLTDQNLKNMAQTKSTSVQKCFTRCICTPKLLCSR